MSPAEAAAIDASVAMVTAGGALVALCEAREGVLNDDGPCPTLDAYDREIAKVRTRLSELMEYTRPGVREDLALLDLRAEMLQFCEVLRTCGLTS